MSGSVAKTGKLGIGGLPDAAFAQRFPGTADSTLLVSMAPTLIGGNGARSRRAQAIARAGRG